MEKIIARRELRGRKPNGDTVRAVAKLYQLSGNPRPHFSVTTDHGCDHESILAAFPELSGLVKLHLADDTGAPMHAIANAQHFAEGGDAAALSRHLGIPHQKAVELIGLVHAEGPSVKPAAEKAAKEQRAALESKVKKLRDLARTYDGTFRGRQHTKAANAIEKELAALPPVDSAVAATMNAARREVVKLFVDEQADGWQAEADKWRAWLDESDTYETGDASTVDYVKPAIQLPGGEVFNVEVVHFDNDRPEITDGDRRYCIFENKAAAGKAARRHWADMAEHDPEEFSCLVGAENLARWGMGKAAGPGSRQVKSLTAWLDLWLETPEEEFSGYDGEEVDGFANTALCEELGLPCDPPEGEDSATPELAGGWRPAKLYRVD